MANGLKIVHEKKMIEMSKGFSKASGNPHSGEYDLLQRVRCDYPDYRLEVRVPKSSKPQERYPGLTYKYMQTYIMSHGTKEEIVENLKIFSEYRLLAYCHSKARSFAFIRSWFLNAYPEVKKFGVKVAKVEEDVEDVEEIEEDEEDLLALPTPVVAC